MKPLQSFEFLKKVLVNRHYLVTSSPRVEFGFPGQELVDQD